MTDGSSRLRLAVIPVTPLRQNAAIVFDEATKRGAVTDPGGDVGRILAEIEELGVTIERILITHGHFDHCGGAAALKAALEKKQGAPVPVEGPNLGDEFLTSRVPEAAARWGMEGFEAVVPDRWLGDGDTVTVGDLVFEVIHCPGHSPGSVVFFQRAARFAVVGDVIFAGSIGRTDLTGGDHATLIDSITRKLLPLGDEIGFLPGHGPMSSFGEERGSNPFLVDD